MEGYWLMIVSGYGVHDDDGRVREDADQMFARFVRELEIEGHVIQVATFQVIGWEPRSVLRAPLNVGDRVLFVDQVGTSHKATVTEVWSRTTVNLKTDDGKEYTLVPRYTRHSTQYFFTEDPVVLLRMQGGTPPHREG